MKERSVAQCNNLEATKAYDYQSANTTVQEKGHERWLPPVWGAVHHDWWVGKEGRGPEQCVFAAPACLQQCGAHTDWAGWVTEPCHWVACSFSFKAFSTLVWRWCWQWENPPHASPGQRMRRCSWLCALPVPGLQDSLSQLLMTGSGCVPAGFSCPCSSKNRRAQCQVCRWSEHRAAGKLDVAASTQRACHFFCTDLFLWGLWSERGSSLWEKSESVELKVGQMKVVIVSLSLPRSEKLQPWQAENVLSSSKQPVCH